MPTQCPMNSVLASLFSGGAAPLGFHIAPLGFHKNCGEKLNYTKKNSMINEKYVSYTMYDAITNCSDAL